MGERSIGTHESVQAYFRELVTEARRSQGVQVAEVTEVYLVNLLSGFLASERLFVREDDGSLREEPLALMLNRALEHRGPERVKALRQLGDTSLWVAGFFPDHVEQKVVDHTYYAAMGHQAYDALARILEKRSGGVAGVYAELAAKFDVLTDLLSEISERVAMTSQRGVVRLYERFLRTGSTRLARLLAEQGVAPAFASPKGWQ